MNALTLPPRKQRIAPGMPRELMWRCSLEQYHAMVEQGILTDEDEVELLAGWMVVKMPTNPPHASATDLLVDALRPLLPVEWIIRSQQPLTLPPDESEPEPDVAMVRGRRQDFFQRHPTPAAVGLVVEVADATLARDRGLKREVYARSAIPEYWLVNLVEKVVEVYSDPMADDQQPNYRTTRVYRPGEAIPLRLDGRELGQIAVASILPVP
ncbi:MAG: Uma2 family endonuclease [Pirellulaceae bacterium]